MTSTFGEHFPGEYPVTPQREETAEATPEYKNPAENIQDTPDQKTAGYIIENNQATPEYEKPAENNQATPDHEKTAGNIIENNQATPEYKNPAENIQDTPDQKTAGYIIENNQTTPEYEKPAENIQATPEHEKSAENIQVTPDHEKTARNITENNQATPDHEKTAENITENSPVTREYVQNKKPEEDLENRKSGDNLENKKTEEENRKPENNPENEENIENKIRESHPLRFEPNPSLKVTDDNDLTKVSDHGSSALGGIGVNPLKFLSGGDESPRHPYFEQKEKEEKELAEKKAAGGDKEAAEGEIDTSHTMKPSNIADQKTYDLTRDYNEQKEQEQIAEHKAKVAQEQDKDRKPSEKHHQKQKLETKKPDRIDLGVKPLGSQQPPLPYKPEEPAGSTDRAYQPQDKTSVVHPEGHNVGSKISKKDKLNATMNKVVGTFKQKIGKLTKNDNLVAKGTEKKAEADRTKEYGGEVMKEI